MDCWYLLNKNYLLHTYDDRYEWAIYLNLVKSEIEHDFAFVDFEYDLYRWLSANNLQRESYTHQI